MRVEAAATRLGRPADPARALHPLRPSDHRRRPDKLRAVGARLAPPSAHVTMHDYKQTVNKSMRAGDAQQRAGRRGRDICEQRGELAACGDQTACGRDASRRGRRLGRSGAAAPTRPLSETGDAVRGGPRSPRPAAGTGTAHPHLPGASRGPPWPRRHHSPLPLWQRASASPAPCIPPSCSSRAMRFRAPSAAATADEGALRHECLGLAPTSHLSPHTCLTCVSDTITLGLGDPRPRVPRCSSHDSVPTMYPLPSPPVGVRDRRPQERARALAAAAAAAEAAEDQRDTI